MHPAFPRARIIRIKNGEIASVSADDTPSLRKCTSSQKTLIDCQGKTVVPGFIDAHCHLVSYANSLVTLDVGPRNVSSISDMKNIVSKAARELPPGTWIKGADTMNSIWPKKGILPVGILIPHRRPIRLG